MQDIYVGKLKMILGTAIQFADNCIKQAQKNGALDGKDEEFFNFVKNNLQELKDKL